MLLMLRRLTFATVLLATPVMAQETVPDTATLRQFAQERLRDAVLLYDRAFRVPETGQYLDAIRLDRDPQGGLSSTAATGMGLVALAIGDVTGVIPDAAEKAEITLAHLLGEHAPAFAVDRSSSGWYRHWFDPYTGAIPSWNKDKFSTIDTAILGAGAAILGNHLREKAAASGLPVPRAAELASALVMSTDWTTAVRNPDRGSIHLVFYGPEERPTDNVATIPFDEYALLPCMAARYEGMLGAPGPATRAWQTRFDMPADLPMHTVGEYTLLGKKGGSIPSHFTHQFAFHLCGTYARDPAFLDEMRELKEADRTWFINQRAPRHIWGLGAGSEPILETDEMKAAQRYGVARLQKNPYGTASPAVMAGFLAVDEADGSNDILADLHTLWARGECRYDHKGVGFLWRCSPYSPKTPVTRVEAIDFSTWMLGLATVHPELGLAFFQRNAF